MERITATPDALVRQASDTAAIYLSHALQWVKATDLPHKDWTAYVGIYVQAATQEVLAAAVRAGVQEVTEGLARLERAITQLAEATGPGLGNDPALLEAMVQETREMTLGEKIAETQALGKNGTNQHSEPEGLDNVKPSYKGGNASTYQIARLKRDRPDIAEALARGEQHSATEGLVNPNPSDKGSTAQTWQQTLLALREAVTALGVQDAIQITVR